MAADLCEPELMGYVICGQCNGSGEGWHDGSTCRACGGEGEVFGPVEDDEESDE